MNQQEISIIIPAYNEARCIEQTVIRIHNFLRNIFKDFEIFVVNDGSRDRTQDILLKLAQKIPELKIIHSRHNRGKGYGVKKGIFAARFNHLLFTDADLSTPIEELIRCFDHLKNGADIVIGSRALKDSQIIQRQSILRQSMGKIFNSFVQIFLFRGIKDTQCGFKCFKRDVAQDIFRKQKLDGFSFDVEILYIAKKRGYTIKELPVRWKNRIGSRVSIFKDPLKMFWDILRIKLYSLGNYYEDQ